MVPVGVAKVEADADPAVAEIGRAEIAGGVAVDQHRLFFGRGGLDEQGGDVVAMMIMAEIGEFLAFFDAEAGHAVRCHLVRLGEGEGAFADFGEQPFGLALARDEVGEGAGIELMLRVQDAGGKSVGGVAGQDGDLRLR